MEQEYVEIVSENHQWAVWRIYDYDEITGRLNGAYDLLDGANWWFVWKLDRLVEWHSDDRNYVREFEYDEEGRICGVWLRDVSTSWRVQEYAYQ